MTDTDQTETKDAGLECPVCGCRHFYTLRTRPVRIGNGRIRRRKQCRNCGRRITTYETATDGPEPWQPPPTERSP